MPVIEVRPSSEEQWGVYIDGELFAVSKNDFDCDYTAKVLASLLNETTVKTNPEARAEILAMMKQFKADKKTASKDLRTGAERFIKDNIGV